MISVQWDWEDVRILVKEDDVDTVRNVLLKALPSDFCESPASKPDGYPDSLVRCVIDSIGSIGVRYGAVENVLRRFDQYCSTEKIRDGLKPASVPSEYLLHFADHLDDEGRWFSEALFDNRQRTSTRGGILKTYAMQLWMEILSSHSIETTGHLRANISNLELRDELKSVRGQKSGISLTYLFMLAGYENGVKFDRMVERWFEKILGHDRTSSRDAAGILMIVSDQIRSDYPCASANYLDHFIWLWQSERIMPRYT